MIRASVVISEGLRNDSKNVEVFYSGILKKTIREEKKLLKFGLFGALLAVFKISNIAATTDLV